MNKKKGFTLIEIIIVTSIFAVVGLGVFSTFVSGMKMWNKARTMNMTQGDVFIAMERMAEDLRQSADIPEIGFEGEDNWVSFPVRIGGDVSKVVYLFDPSGKGVFRRQIPLTDISEEDSHGSYEQRRALSADKFVLEYFAFDQNRSAYFWDYVWEKSEEPFSAIRLLIEKNEKVFTKTVFIPMAG